MNFILILKSHKNVLLYVYYMYILLIVWRHRRDKHDFRNAEDIFERVILVISPLIYAPFSQPEKCQWCSIYLCATVLINSILNLLYAVQRLNEKIRSTIFGDNSILSFLIITFWHRNISNVFENVFFIYCKNHSTDDSTIHFTKGKKFVYKLL